MAKKGKSPSKPLKDPKHDEEGNIMNWDSNWDDALVLRMYIEKGFVTGLTALKIQEKYPETFGKYTNKALTGGLKTLRDSVAKEFAAARAGGSNGAFAHLRVVNPSLMSALTDFVLPLFSCQDTLQPCWQPWYDPRERFSCRWHGQQASGLGRQAKGHRREFERRF